MPDYREVVCLASALREDADSPSAAIVTYLDGPGVKSQQVDCQFYLSITAKAGTSPTLDVHVYGVVGGVDYLLDSFTQEVAEATQILKVTNCPKTVKIYFDVGGSDTPSFTFSVDAHRFDG